MNQGLLSVDEALARLLAEAKPVAELEEVPTLEATNRILARAQTSSLGIGANLKPSTRSRSQGEMRFTCSSNEGSCAPRSSCIRTQRREEVTRISQAPAWRWR